MFKDLFVQLLEEHNITAYKLSKDTGITEGLISQWKSGRQLPKYESIKTLCDYFNVSADYLLERVNRKGELLIMNIQNLSEAQRAMMKYHIRSLLESKYSDENFYSQFEKDLEIDNSLVWFKLLPDTRLDNKIPQILELLGRTFDNLFNDLYVDIDTKTAADKLKIDYDKDTRFPITRTGNLLFDKLSSMTLNDLYGINISQPNSPAQATAAHGYNETSGTDQPDIPKTSL